MLFFVSYIDNVGKQNLEFLEVEDYDTLLELLESRDLTPLNIHQLPKFLSFLAGKGTRGIKTDEIIELLDNLHLIIKSGLPLYHGIMDIAEDSQNPSFKKMLLSIALDINKGNSLSHAFEPYKKLIDPMVLNLMKIGEETGQLESTLKQSADFLKKIHSLKKKAKSALIYPAFALTAVIGAMLVWMIYVLPQMSELFKQMDIELPPLTIAIMNVADFLKANIIYIAIGFVIFIILFKLVHSRYRVVRFYTDKFILKIPIIKQIVSGFNIAFISEYIRLAISSGVPIFSAISSLRTNIKNELYKNALEKITDDVSKGAQLSTAFSKTKMFTSFTIRMIGVGESAGTLESQLSLIANYYNERVDYYAQNIGKVIEPLVLIIVGGFMAVVMVGLMGPLYNLITQMQ